MKNYGIVYSTSRCSKPVENKRRYLEKCLICNVKWGQLNKPAISPWAQMPNLNFIVIHLRFNVKILILQ